jgi:hypothetical protein
MTMKIVDSKHDINGVPRPALYLSADGTWTSGTEKIVEAVKGLQRGSIYVCPDDTVSDLEWRYRASWSGNVVAFWFSKGDVNQETKMLELGIQMGRYCAGAGANRIIIGAHENYHNLGYLKEMVSVANLNLSGSWKFQVITDFKAFIQKLKDVLV